MIAVEMAIYTLPDKYTRINRYFLSDYRSDKGILLPYMYSYPYPYLLKMVQAHIYIIFYYLVCNFEFINMYLNMVL